MKTFGVIRDADNDAEGAFNSVCSVLENNRLKPPNGHGEVSKGMPKTGIFIIPNGKSPGMLETLCLSSVKFDGIKGCIDSFMNCINCLNETGLYKKPKNKEKARFRAFLAAMEEDTSSLGIAAQNLIGIFHLTNSILCQTS